MASNQDRVEYDLQEEEEYVTEYEDTGSEHESELSDDEFDDQGLDNYGEYPDYIDIEEEPLHARASRRVAAAATQRAPTSDQQAGPSTDPQPGASADDLNDAFIAQDSQFEDASSPEKQATAATARFSLRSLSLKKNPSMKRSYTEDHGSDEDNTATPRRTPVGRGGSRRMFASLDPDQPSSSGSDPEYVPEVPAVPAAAAVPDSTSKRGRGRPRSTPKGRGRGRGAPAQDVHVAPGLIGPVDLNQVPVGPAADVPAADTREPEQDPVAPIPIAEPVVGNRVPVGRVAGRLQALGDPPYPGHNWAVGYELHPFERNSYKRARGPLGNKSGPNVRFMMQDFVLSKDKTNKWFNSPAPDVADMQLPQHLPEAGHPNHDELSDVRTMEGFFFALFTEDILEHIVDMTNIEMHLVRTVASNMSEQTQNSPVFQDISLLELKAFLGCLIMSGVRHDGQLNLKMMFSVKYGVLFYRSLFSLKRFEWIIRTIRFDVRGERAAGDKFAAFRTVWDKFVANCKRLYVAGPIVTVDEMLAPFRGRVSFRMYIPLKPDKYGVKIFCINDSGSQYALNLIPYLGKNSDADEIRRQDVNQGEFYTMKLLENLKAPGRVVVLDNWFTSLHLAQTLRRNNMHLVGTIRMNKPYLPSKAFIKDLKLPKDDSVIFHYRPKAMSLIVKKVRASKYVGILSTIHNKLTVVEKMKTQAHMFYNAGKGGTDAFDQRCSVTSCKRRSRRWSMAVFYQTINIGMNNAFILYIESNFRREKGYNIKADYLHEIAYRMARPFAVHKYQRTHHTQRESKTMLDMVFKLDAQEKAGAGAAAAGAAAAGAADAAPVPADADVAVGLGRRYVVPAAVPGAIREVPPVPEPEIPYRGGRWTATGRNRCSLCPRPYHWRGKYKCEMPECRHRDVCIHHSVILCQNCFRGNN